MIKKILPNYLIRFILKAGIFILLFTLCRLVFLIFNTNSFPVVYFTDFLAGIWFDTVTTAIVFLPLIALEIFPNKWRGNKWIQLLLLLAFHITLFLCILINLIDVEYFKFSASRSTSSLFTMLSFGNDFAQQIPSIVSDYWYLLLILIAFQVFGGWLYKRVNRIKDDSKTIAWWKQSLILVLVAFTFVVVGRGGFGLRPIAAPKAAAYTIDQNVPLVLNSAFTVIKTWGSVSLEEKDYFSEEELIKIFNPIHQYNHPAKLNSPNIVIILLESFSVEYISAINGTNEVYTPFLDSLIDSSLVFTNCYSNGKKSIDAMPSIISSIPKLMEIEYLTSQYASNKIESLPKILSQYNYNSSFFHGATNGSMNFDVFCDVAGFNNYFGRTEYNNDKDYDGTWGIYDEEFLSWTADKLSTFKSPFFSTIFTISSHPPYSIPGKHATKFNQGPSEMHDAVRYADYALHTFFEKIKNSSWYSNTLFVIAADHTPASASDIYYKDMGNMHIPLLFFYPNSNLLHGRNDKVVGQVDVMPSILDLIGHQQAFFAFGNSVFDSLPGRSSSYIGNKYIHFADYLNESYMLTYQDDEITGIFNLEDQLQITNLLDDVAISEALLNQLKAIIQTYNKALIQNKMTTN